MAERSVVVDMTVLARVRARLRVLAGAGGRLEERAFEHEQPSRVLVGSDPSASLRLERPDVAPRQFEVVWDGAQLWLQDPLRLGRTFVNGRTLNEWQPVISHAVVCFGGVRIWMASRAEAPSLATPDFDALDRARLTEAHHNARARLSETGRITLPPELMQAANERDAR
jgi:hypothetical protein